MADPVFEFILYFLGALGVLGGSIYFSFSFPWRLEYEDRAGI